MDHEQDLPELAPSDNGQGLTYHQAMNWMCHITLRHMSWKRTSEPMPSPLLLLRDLGLVQQALSPHMRNPCGGTSLQQIREYHAFQLHLNFTISTLCRPVIAEASPSFFSTDDKACILNQLRVSLQHSGQAYIRYRAVACYARRSWASIHNGLASVLLLSLMKETRDEGVTRDLQDQLIGSIAQGEVGYRLQAGLMAIDLLSDTHKKALAAIQKLRQLSEHDSSITNHDIVMNDSTRRPAPGSETAPALNVGQDPSQLL